MPQSMPAADLVMILSAIPLPLHPPQIQCGAVVVMALVMGLAKSFVDSQVQGGWGLGDSGAGRKRAKPFVDSRMCAWGQAGECGGRGPRHSWICI